MLSDIIAGAPLWVFPLFFVLAFYGWLQSRPRAAGTARVVMLPAIMTTLSIGGVLSSFGAHPAGVVAWACGFAVALGLNQLIRAPRGVTYDATTRRFHLPGGWIPLILMLAIYFAKYTVGVMTVMRPDIATSTPFAIAMSLLFGLISGTFFARFLRIWSTRRGASAVAAADTTSEQPA